MANHQLKFQLYILTYHEGIKVLLENLLKYYSVGAGPNLKFTEEASSVLECFPYGLNLNYTETVNDH